MKKQLLLAIAGLLIISLPGMSQDCTAYFPMEKGAVTEYEHFNKRGKLSGITRQEVIDKKVDGGMVSLTINSIMMDKSGEEISNADLTLECRGGVFTFDMNSFMNDEMLAAVEDMEFSIEGESLEYPAKMQVGDELKDGKITLTVEGMAMMNMETTIFNRKVLAEEDITTKAGTFKCYKISYDILTDAMINVKGSAVEWIARDVGAVRSESYNKGGKLTGSTELVKLKR